MVVDGAAADVATYFADGGPARYVTIEGTVLFANWSNVLYIEEIAEETSEFPPGLGPGPTDAAH